MSNYTVEQIEKMVINFKNVQKEAAVLKADPVMYSLIEICDSIFEDKFIFEETSESKEFAKLTEKQKEEKNIDWVTRYVNNKVNRSM